MRLCHGPAGQPPRVGGARGSARRLLFSGAVNDALVNLSDLLQPMELDELERVLAHDEFLRERMFELLDEHGFDTDAVLVDVGGGCVLLAGHVNDPLQRLLIEDLAWSLEGVRHCENELELPVPAEAAVAA